MSQRNDDEYQWLLDAGAAPAQLNDMWFEYLRGLGYVGALDDMKKKFWEDQNVTPPVSNNLYPNPTLIGGSNIVADVFATAPNAHVATAFGGVPCDATYLGAGNPAFTFVGTGNSRFAWSCNVNTATNRGVTLPGGREYRFSATVQSIGEAASPTRLINLASPTNGAVVTDGPLYVPDGTPQNVYLDFLIPNANSTIQMRHGMGMFNAVLTPGATQQTTNLKLEDIGPLPLLFDDFSGADDTLLINRAPNIGPQPTVFGVDTSPKIVSNAVFSSIAGRQICRYNVGQVNKKVSFNVIGVGNIVVFRLRVDMAAVDQNHVYFTRSNTNFQIVRIQGGVANTRATANRAFVSGERVVITDDGNVITANIDGQEISANETFLNTITDMGLQVNGVNTSIDNLKIDSFATGPDLIGDNHTLTAGTNGALNRVGYRRGSWGDFQPDDIPALNRFFTRTDIDRLVIEMDGDWTAYVFAGIEIERVSTSVIETFGSPNLESYDGTVTRWRWDVPFKFTDGEDYIVKVLQ